MDAHINLGLLHHDAGDLTEAETCYRRALQCGPESALAHFNLAVVLEDRGDKSGALKAYAEALRRAPDFREAHCNLAHLYEQLGRRLDAIRSHDRYFVEPTGGPGVSVGRKFTRREVGRLRGQNRRPHSEDPNLSKGVIGVSIYVGADRVGDTASLYVGQVLREGPARQAGIKAGDEVVTVNGAPVLGKAYDEIVQMVRGESRHRSKIGSKKRRGGPGRYRSLVWLSKNSIHGKI